jgi:hypothetical protein
MPKFPLDWLDAGMILDLLFALQIHLMKSGKVGQRLKALYYEKNHRWGDTAAFAVPAAIGIIFPPYMLAGLIHFCVRVKQERDKARGQGRPPSKRATSRLFSQRGGN